MTAEVLNDDPFAEHGTEFGDTTGLESDVAGIAAVAAPGAWSTYAAISSRTDSGSCSSPAARSSFASVSGIPTGHIQHWDPMQHDVLK